MGAQVYFTEFRPMELNPNRKLSAHALSRMPKNPGFWECRTPLAPGYRACAPTEAQAKRIAAKHVRDFVRPRRGL